MKIVCVFFFCFLAGVLADGSEEDKIAKYLAECRKEFGVENKSSAEISKMFTDYQSACFAFCMYKKRGLMNEDGTFNKAAMLAGNDQPSKNTGMERLLENCEKKIKPVDGCKLAACLHGGNL